MDPDHRRSPKVRRGRPGLTRHAIVARALEIADSEGVDQVSFRRLATDFAVTPMALYTHVEDKADLLNAMADLVLRKISVQAAQAVDWADRLRDTLSAAYAAFDKHPAAGALIARPLASAPAMALTEALLACLDEAGFSPGESMSLVQVLTGMVLGPVILQSAYGRLAGQTMESPDRERARYVDFIGHLTEGEYPTLFKVLPAMLDWPSPAELRELCVELLVDGLRTMSSSSRGRGARQSRETPPATKRKASASPTQVKGRAPKA